MKLGKLNSDENGSMRWNWKNGDKIESKETKLKEYVYYMISVRTIKLKNQRLPSPRARAITASFSFS